MKIYLVLSLLLAPSLLWGQGYHIRGQISGLQDGDTVQINEISHKWKAPLAETVVRNGEFSFSGDQPDPRGVYVQVKGCNGAVPLILDNHQIVLSGTAARNDSQKIPFYRFQVKVSGSPLTDELNEKLKVRVALDSQYADYHRRYADISNQVNKAAAAHDSAEMKRLMATPEYGAFMREDHRFFTAVDSTYSALFAQNKDSWWGPFLMEATLSYFSDEQKPAYELLTENAKNSYYGKMVHDELYPADYTGKKVPDFTVSDGKTLKDLLAGKKYVLIDFWASWCVPCRREIPNLKKLYALYAGKGFQIVSLSIDRDAAAWKKAKAEENMPWPGYLDTQGISGKYGVRFIPMMFLVDHEGRLVSDKLRGEELAQKLSELFHE
ncbi:MAG: AhpC/TSA family protein [Prevotella sp.]|jgi:thiol-disulfide isomerase/thioredoxin|nr:TlpA disulfide reductase family protein [uncultured Prevotella sp.]MCI1246441.1 AhpC/TSA family protein [Prevotella sp.]